MILLQVKHERIELDGYVRCLFHLSNEKRAPGWLGCIGDDELPSYIGIFSINHCKDPY